MSSDILASVGTHTINGIKTIASGVASGAKGIAHGALYVTAETTDFLAKGVSIAGPFVSVVLLGDAYAFGKGHSLLLNPCGEHVPLFALNLVQQKTIHGTIGCVTTASKADLSNVVRIQALAGFALLLVATPIVSLACRKISNLANNLNNSF